MVQVLRPLKPPLAMADESGARAYVRKAALAGLILRARLSVARWVSASTERLSRQAITSGCKVGHSRGECVLGCDVF